MIARVFPPVLIARMSDGLAPSVDDVAAMARHIRRDLAIGGQPGRGDLRRSALGTDDRMIEAMARAALQGFDR